MAVGAGGDTLEYNDYVFVGLVGTRELVSGDY